jgi:hypothetical protein
MNEDVQKVGRQDLLRAFRIFADAVDADDISDGGAIDAQHILIRIAEQMQIDDPHQVVALFKRCIALQNAAEDGMFKPSDEGVIPDLAIEAACGLPVAAGDDSDSAAMSFDREQFARAMQSG